MEIAMLPTNLSHSEFGYLNKIYTIYGEPKIGKTTLTSNLGDENHKILFFCTEPGHKFVNVYKWTRDSEGTEYPKKWEDFLACARELIVTRDQHNFTALAIDTIDNLYEWASEYACNKLEIDDPSDAGFGKGFNAVKKEIKKVIDTLANHGFGLIFISHEQTNDKNYKGKTFSYTEPTMPGSFAKYICGLSDYILYLHTNEQGERVVLTKANENVRAGDRSGKLPEVMPLRSKVLKEALNAN